jgi:hypothetical protein
MNIQQIYYSFTNSSLSDNTFNDTLGPIVIVTIIGPAGGAIVAVAIIILFVSIIVCFSLKSKKGKKSSSLNLDTSQADSMMITGNTSNPQPIVQEQTVPIYAEINKKQNPSVQEYNDNGLPSNDSIGQYFLLNDVETPPIPPISPPANSTEAPLHSYEYSVVNKLVIWQSITSMMRFLISIKSNHENKVQHWNKQFMLKLVTLNATDQQFQIHQYHSQWKLPCTLK